jgi:serine/threonine-protein kinase
VTDDEPAWADESADKAKGNGGTIGLIAVAVVIMVVVYVGATMLMK